MMKSVQLHQKAINPGWGALLQKFKVPFGALQGTCCRTCWVQLTLEVPRGNLFSSVRTSLIFLYPSPLCEKSSILLFWSTWFFACLLPKKYVWLAYHLLSFASFPQRPTSIIWGLPMSSLCLAILFCLCISFLLFSALFISIKGALVSTKGPYLHLQHFKGTFVRP